MIAQPSNVKIQQNQPQFIQIIPQVPSQCSKRLGNSHIYAKTGHWTDQQKLRYLMFIDYHHDKLTLKENRRQRKVFKAMSTFIRTRKPNQCRSHHSKMETYFQSTQSIISYFKDKIHNYLEEYERSQEELSHLQFAFTAAPNHYNMEESISNNEQGQSISVNPCKRRVKGSRTSIKLAEQEQNPQLNDKNLPKTDQSLNHSSLQQQNHPHNSRPSFSFSFIHNEPMGYKLGLGFVPFWSQQNIARMDGFFEYYKSKSSSEIEMREWSECEQLYLLWRSKYQCLAQQHL